MPCIYTEQSRPKWPRVVHTCVTKRSLLKHLPSVNLQIKPRLRWRRDLTHPEEAKKHKHNDAHSMIMSPSEALGAQSSRICRKSDGLIGLRRRIGRPYSFFAPASTNRSLAIGATGRRSGKFWAIWRWRTAAKFFYGGWR